ncbi:MAG: hypothetical protein QME12_06030 [Nanoarchaeota archaeon]|nr:hypothetical protein [Nanoarchaeota archaeon]
MGINSKKGQTEDIFSDLIISLIIIGITIGAVGVGQIFEKRNSAAKSTNDLTELYGADILTLLRSPMPHYLFETNPLLKDKGITFGKMLGIIADNDRENNPWIFSKQIPPAYSGNYGMVSTDSKECTQRLREAIDSRLEFMWQLGIYNDAGSEELRCSSYKNVMFFDERYAGSGMYKGCKVFNIKVPTKNGKTATMKWGVCP